MTISIPTALPLNLRKLSATQDTPHRLQARQFLQFLNQAIAGVQLVMAEAHAIVVHNLANRTRATDTTRRRLNLSLEELANHMNAKKARATCQATLMVLVPIRRKVIGGIQRMYSFVPEYKSEPLASIGFYLGTTAAHSLAISESTLLFTQEVTERFPLLFPVNFAKAKAEHNARIRAETQALDKATAELREKENARLKEQAQLLYNKILGSGILTGEDIPVLRRLFFGS